ncbi:MAG TPA: SDR family NAD(P)-dependent oxidoreductase [Terriglobales bacterium]|nr:SDR family NAD(P)-dependent oxidoreductase [Terriglobales bacterium]
MTKGKKTVVITGASSGIGRTCVSRMIEAGWQVFATVRKTEDAARLRSECGGQVVPLLMDVTDHASVRIAVEPVLSQLGTQGLDGLVNVAGVGIVGPVEFVSPAGLSDIFAINAFGQIVLTQAFLPLIHAARGRIVNITTVGAHFALPFGGLLNGSKAAFSILCDALRLELHPFGIRVCTVEPGAIKTPAVDKTLGHVENEIASLPERGRQQYGDLLRNFARRGYEREMHGSPPEVVATAVHHALTARQPRIRYRVGKHSTVLGILPRLLPDRIFDALRLRIAGMPTKFGSLSAGKES